MMSYRILLYSVIAAAVSALLLFGQFAFAADSEKARSVNAEGTVFLGQEDLSNTPSLGHRVKNWVSRFLEDEFADYEEQPAEVPENRLPVVVQPAIPMNPPKPLTAAEVQQSAAEQKRTASTARQGSASRQSTASRNTSIMNSSTLQYSAFNNTAINGALMNNSADEEAGEEDESTEDSLFSRMGKYRRSFITNPALEEAAIASRQRSTTPALAPSPAATLPAYSGAVPAGPSTLSDPFSAPAVPERKNEPDPERNLTQTPALADVRQITQSNPLRTSLTEQKAASQTALSPVAAESNAIAVSEQQEKLVSNQQLVVSESPRFGVEIEKPQVSVVGQEVTYRIRFSNTGTVPIEQVVLAAEIPAWIDFRHAETNSGKADAMPRSDGSGISDLTWKISRVEPGTTDLLILRLVPQQRRSIELVFNCDYHRPGIVAKVEVQEPKLELELLGAEEVMWSDLVAYTLLVRNVGNGNAENLKLTLQQTNSDASQCEFEEPLRPGEEQPITITVQAGKEQEYIDIAVLAIGSHDLRGEVKRRIRVLRPKLELSVNTPAFHFVDNPAVFTIRVRNTGSADAENMTIRAELPLGAQYDTSSEGGVFTTQEQLSVVEWRGRSIVRGETQTFLLTCLPKREGECRVTVEACDSTGTVLAGGNSTFTAEAISELELNVQKPKGHVELGQEAEYSIQVTNIGTKAAENVEISMAFGWKEGSDSVAVLEPINVAGGEASLYNGMVTFEKIPVILPKQSVELKVIAKAEQVGTVPIKTQVSGKDISGSVGNELSTTVFSRQNKFAQDTNSDSQHEVH